MQGRLRLAERFLHSAEATCYVSTFCLSLCRPSFVKSYAQHPKHRKPKPFQGAASMVMACCIVSWFLFPTSEGRTDTSEKLLGGFQAVLGDHSRMPFTLNLSSNMMHWGPCLALEALQIPYTAGRQWFFMTSVSFLMGDATEECLNRLGVAWHVHNPSVNCPDAHFHWKHSSPKQPHVHTLLAEAASFWSPFGKNDFMFGFPCDPVMTVLHSSPFAEHCLILRRLRRTNL